MIEIELTPETMKALGSRSVRNGIGCFVCSIILENAKDGKLTDSKKISLQGQLAHLQVEFGIDPRDECPECLEMTPLRHFDLALDLCVFCKQTVLEDGDKKWIT